MSTGRYARWTRPAPAVNVVLLAFTAIYTSIVALSFAAVWMLQSRLPVDARNLASVWLESELIVIAVYLGWIVLGGHNRKRRALETVLPVGLSGLGILAAGLTVSLWFNLDATTFQMPIGSLAGIGLYLAGSFAGLLVGRYLGGLAVSSRLSREAVSSRRSAWFAEASSDGSWRKVTGIVTGFVFFPMILLAQATAPAYGPGSPLPFQLLLALAWAFSVVVGDHATISITNTAVKVRTRLLSNSMGWSVSISEIAGAQAIVERPEALRFDRSRIVLRTGPALELKTVTGSRYLVSLDGAAEAVAVIEALRSAALSEGM
jgi:hypothetical protein